MAHRQPLGQPVVKPFVWEFNFRLSQIKGQGISPGAIPSVYAAPEIHDGRSPIDYRADIYSLGVVLYEMLTSRLPVGYFAPASKIAGVDARFDEIIRGALQHDRESRWQTTLDISAIIKQIRKS